MLIEKKLGKYEELLFQILIGEIDCRVHDSDAVCSNRIGYVTYVYRVQVLICALTLNEYLIVQVVQIASDKHVNVAHDLQHIEALRFNTNSILRYKLELKIEKMDYLFQSGTWQIRIGQGQVVLLLGQISHLAVRFPIVQSYCGQIVEGFVQIAFHVSFHINKLVIDYYWIKIDELDQVLEAVFEQLGLIRFEFKMN